VPTRRRLLAVIAAGTLAVAGLAGCRNGPEVAAYVGSNRITHEQVRGIVDDLIKKEPSIADRRAELQQNVLQLLVVRDAARQYAQRQGITIPPADTATFAQQSQLPPDATYTTIAAEYSAALTAVEEKVKSVAPNEADQREAYHNATVNGQPVTDKFEDVQQYFNEEALGSTVGQRNLMRDMLQQANVVVNPRYSPISAKIGGQIGQVPTFLEVPLGKPEKPFVANRT
jgi:hypothetical protein